MVIAGHRGYPLVAPENTLAGVEAAIAAGAATVEFDVRACADGTLVIHHDARFGPLGELLKHLSYAEVLRHGRPDAPVPTLEEMVAACRGQVVMDIELKAPDCARDAIRQLVDNLGVPADEAVISSFSAAALQTAREEAPLLRRGLIVGGYPLDVIARGDLRPWGRVEAVGADVLICEWHLAAGLAPGARRRGIEPWAWNANDESAWRACRRHGVSTVITDAVADAVAFFT